MNIIHFPSIQTDKKTSVPNHPNETSPLLLQYRDSTQGEFLVWAICVVCAVASIVLSLSQLQNDVSRVQRVHANQIGVNRLADKTPYISEVSQQL